ncbi:MAG TPA: DUF5131 family protein, partial [Caulobacteraceae bacterium]|nr:DUF5131 family protein [Caulobacteraceae bacterium]
MAIDSGITWTDDTLNPWIGCTKVSPACDACYAEDMMDRRYHRVVWGKPGAGAGTRVQTKHWRSEIRKSEREAVAQWKVTGQPRFVFCLSLGDIFDNQVPAEWRRDVFEEIRKAPHCVFLLLTKRPQNIVRLFEEITEKDQEHDALSDYWPPNAAIGCTAVTQEEADRDVPVLLEAKRILGPTFAFLSIEPMLGPIDLFKAGAFRYPSHRSVNWVITGGESDQGAFKARPAHPQWFR